ncbi:MAG: hypothetical protein WC223_12215 [Bacteroidales bacterium]|jgi:hypothetical protein
MKVLILIIISYVLIISNCFSQQQKDYIITLDNGKVFCNIKGARLTRILCEIDNKRIEYKAKNILVYKNGDNVFESGKAKLVLGFRKWLFMQRAIIGDLNLYQISGNTSSYYYIRRSDNPRGIFLRLKRKNLKKICSDCPVFIDKINNDRQGWLEIYKYVGFFNDNCGKKKK